MTSRPVQIDPPAPNAGTVIRRRTALSILKDGIRKLTPKFVLDELRRYRRSNDVALPLYVKLRISAGIRASSPRNQHLQEVRCVLFLCFGNIMRSPMCEALMSRALQSGTHRPIKVMSAGLNATDGREAHPWAISAARELGVSLEEHRARSVRPEMIGEADLILTMDTQNYAQLISRFPAARAKTLMLGSFDTPRRLEIADPFFEGPQATSHCYRVLGACIDSLLRHLECDSSKRNM